MNIECLFDHRCLLAEGPLWDPDRNQLIWVDIEGQALHGLNADGTGHFEKHFTGGITSISVTDSGFYLCTSENAFMVLDRDFRIVVRSDPLISSRAGIRFNDAKVDPAGRLWAGTMDRELKDPKGSLYLLDDKLNRYEKDTGYVVSNGPAFSRNGGVLFHTDSLQRAIYRFALAESGDISDKSVFARFDGAEGYPDGMTTDAEGYLWVCSFGGARITRFSGDGERVGKISLPVSNITSCAFGGNGYSSLFVTTASSGLGKEQLAGEPLAGSIFRIDCVAEGLPPNRFRLSPEALSRWTDD